MMAARQLQVSGFSPDKCLWPAVSGLKPPTYQRNFVAPTTIGVFT
jgi:hypothetical protein